MGNLRGRASFQIVARRERPVLSAELEHGKLQRDHVPREARVKVCRRRVTG